MSMTASSRRTLGAPGPRRGTAPALSECRTLGRRSLLLGGLGAGAAGFLAACASDSTSASPSTTSTSGGAASTEPASAGTATAPGPEYHEPSSDNTALTAGSWTGTIGDKEITLAGAFLVDGVQAVIDGGTFASTSADEAVFLVVNGGTLSVTNARIAKSGDATTDGEHGVDDAYNFYGLNSAVVAVGEGSSVSIRETALTTDASGANAVLTTSSAAATVDACLISTSGESSRGLHATYGGIITGSDLSIETQGAHCAAVATDRGSGTVTVDGTNTFSTNGDGSPCIYSTGEITVSGLTGTAGMSQAIVIEGKNHATVSDSTLSAGSDSGGVMLYQSMSGDAADSDAATEQSTLVLTDVTLTCTRAVPTLYVTNTSSQATLTRCALHTSGGLATADEDRWGASGSNGGTLALTLDDTSSDGAITAGSSSSIVVTTLNGGSATGTTSGDVTVG